MNSSKLQFKTKYILVFALGVVFALTAAVALVPAEANAAVNWVANPASCPQSDPVNFPGQNCAPNNMCGDSSGIAQCYNTASIPAPAVNANSSVLYASAVGGGYVINCFVASDAGVPYCDNSGAAWCNRDATCYGGGNNRLTTCLAGHWASEGAGAFTCGDCLTTHLDCTGDTKCEVQKNVTTYPTGGNNHYGTTCDAADVRCNTSYYDCDATGVTVGNGCEAYRAGACTGAGGLTGTWSCAVDAGGTCTDGGSNYTCTCVTPKCPFESATLCQYFSADPLLWGKQLGSGELIRIGNSIKEDAFVVENDGSIRMATTSAPGDTTGLLYNVGGDLYWDGTLVGAGASSSALDFQQVTDLGNITTNWIQFAGGTSTADFSITGNLNVTGDAIFVNATGTNIAVAEQFLLGQYAVLPVAGYRPGAMVYNTTDSSPYFWDGTQWVAFATGTGASAGDLQAVTDIGNITTNWIEFAGGTSTDSVSILGNVGINTLANPAYQLYLYGGPNYGEYFAVGDGRFSWGDTSDAIHIFANKDDGEMRLSSQSNISIGDLNNSFTGARLDFDGQNGYTYFSNSNVGIGTASPMFTFHTVNDGTFLGAFTNSTFSEGIMFVNDNWGDEIGMSDIRSDGIIAAVSKADPSAFYYANRVMTARTDIQGLGINTDPARSLHVYAGYGETALARMDNDYGSFEMHNVNTNPNGFATGTIGSLAVDSTSGRLYIKETGMGTNTGWAAFATGTGSGAGDLQAVTDIGNLTTNWIQFAGGTSTGNFLIDRPSAEAYLTVRSGNSDAYFDLIGNAGATALRMSSNGGSDYATFEIASNGSFNMVAGGTNTIWADATNGNVGIGTNTTLSRLHVFSEAASTTAIVTHENNAGDYQQFLVTSNPQGLVTGSRGDLAIDSTNGRLYIKETGNGTNTGWVAFATGTGAGGGTLDDAYNFGGAAAGRQIFTVDGANPVEIINPGLEQWETGLALSNGVFGGGLAFRTQNAFGDRGARIYFTTDTSDPENGTGSYMDWNEQASAFEFGYQTAGTRNSSFYIDYNQMALNVPGTPSNGALGILAGNYNVPVLRLAVPGPALSNQIHMSVGTSTPEAKVTAESGSLFFRTDGVGSSQQLYVKTTDAGNTGWFPLAGAGVANSIWDADSDTGVQVEESADEDIIRFDVAGYEAMRIDPTLGEPLVSINSTLGGYAKILQNINDEYDHFEIRAADALNAFGGDLVFNFNPEEGFALYYASNQSSMNIGRQSFGVSVNNNLDAIKVDQNAFVGLSTSSPMYRLDVVGDARVSEQLMLGQYALNPLVGLQAGAMVYNTASSTPFFWDGTEWIAFATGTGAAAGDLQAVTDLGNITTNWIEFAGGTSTNDFAIIRPNAETHFSVISGNSDAIIILEGNAGASELRMSSDGGGNSSGLIADADGSMSLYTSATGRNIHMNSATGYVGVNTIIPDARLTVSGEGATANSALSIENYSSNLADFPGITFKAAQGDSGTIEAVDSGKTLGAMVFQGHNGTTYDPGSVILSRAVGDWDGVNNGANLIFYTTELGGGFLRQRASIDSEGLYIGSHAGHTALAPLDIDVEGGIGSPAIALNSSGTGFMIFNSDADPEGYITGSVGDLAVDSVSGVMYIKETGDATNTGWSAFATGTAGALDLQQVTDNGNITTNWIEFAGGTSTGTIIPGANNTYALGSSARRWSDVWGANVHIGTSTWDLAQAANGALTVTRAGGSEAMRILTNGNVGIGTELPGAYRLNVAGSSYFSVGEDTSVFEVYNAPKSNTHLRVDGDSDYVVLQENSGFVGIGTSAPTDFLHVQGNSDSRIARFSNSLVADGFGFGADLYGGEAGLYEFRGQRLLVGHPIGDANVLMLGQDIAYANQNSKLFSIGTSTFSHQLLVRGSDTGGDNLFRVEGGLNGGYINMYVSSTDDRNSVIGFQRNLEFFSQNQMIMTITNNQRIGVGITSPAYRLDVSGDARLSAQFMLGQYAVNPVSGLQAGAMIYNTASSTPFYWNGTSWKALASQDLITLDRAYDAGGSGVGRQIRVDSGAVWLTDAGNGTALQVDYSGSGDAIAVTNGSTGKGFVLAQTGSGVGMYIRQNNGTGLVVENNTGNYGVYVDVNSTGDGVRLNNYGSGANALYIDNSADGYGINIDHFSGVAGMAIRNDVTSDGNLIDLTNQSSGAGVLVENSGAGYGIQIPQTGSGQGMYIRQNAGIGIQLDNNTINHGLSIDNNSSGEGLYIDNSGGGNAISLMNRNATGNGIRIDQDIDGSGIYIDDTAGKSSIYVSKSMGAGDLVYLTNSGTGDSLEISHASSGKAIRLSNTGIGDSLYITDEASDSTPFVLTANGDLGIGAASPDARLEIAGDASLADVTLLKFQATNDNDIQSEIYFSAGGNATNWNVNSSGNGGALSILDGTTQVAKFMLNGVVINDGSTAGIDFRVESDTNTHALFVDATNGNVGFDQTTPLAKLHVGGTTAGSAADYNYLRLEGSGDVDHRVYLPTGSNLMIWDYNATGNGGAIEFRDYTTRVGMFTNSGLVINEGGVTGVGLRVEGDTIANLLYTDAANDRVGIGTNAPAARFHATQSANTVAVFDRTTSDGTIISLRQAGVEEGTISVSGTTVSYNAFTGSHYAWTDELMERGMLVSLTGDNRNLHNNPQSEIVYGVTKTAIANDSKVMGSYLALQESNKAYDESNPHLIMAVGNGEVWVADKGENINIGDYLISSDVAGHAQKDAGEFIVSHIIAKAAESIDWSSVTSEIDGVKHKKISVFFESFDKSNMQSSVAGTSLQGGDSNLEVVDLAVSNAIFEGNVTVMGHVTLSRDAVGQAMILTGENKVTVTFEVPYDELPVVTVTPFGAKRMDYGVENVSLTGFDIVIDPIQYQDIIFNWHAFGNREAKVFVSNGTTLDIEMTEMGSSKLESDINSNGQAIVSEPVEEVGVTEPESTEPATSTEPTFEPETEPEPEQTSEISTEPEPASVTEPESEQVTETVIETVE